MSTADHDGDSQMLSSPSDSDTEQIQTPLAQTTTSSSNILSPPDSQHRSNTSMPTSTSGSTIANANGKRPINTISNGAEDDEQAPTIQNGGGKARAEFATKTHERSGYSWNRAIDEPGYAWMNKKAMDEFQRAWDGLVQKENMVKGELYYVMLSGVMC